MKPQTAKIDSIYALKLDKVGSQVELGVLAFGRPLFCRVVDLEAAQDLRDKLDAVICAAQLERSPA